MLTKMLVIIYLSTLQLYVTKGFLIANARPLRNLFAYCALDMLTHGVNSLCNCMH